jgi:hypothetical protein
MRRVRKLIKGRTIYDRALFDTLLGPTRSISAVQAQGTIGSDWITAVETAQETQWTAYTYNGNPTYTTITAPTGSGWCIAYYFYYGRSDVYFALYKMGGYANTTYLDRGQALAQFHYDDYYGPNYHSGSGLLHHNQMNKSMALLYAITGNSNVLAALGKNGDQTVGLWNRASMAVQVYGPSVPWSFPTLKQMDPRMKGKTLELYVLCHICNAPSTGGPGGFPGGNNWLTKAEEALEDLLDAQDVTGCWRDMSEAEFAGYDPFYPNKPFMAGILMDALIFYYDNIDADSRIPTAIEAQLDYFETGGSYTGNTGPLWVPAQDSWKYLEFTDDGSDPGGTAGIEALNGLISQSCAFLYRVNGTAAWKTRCEEALVSANAYTDYMGIESFAVKQYNETFTRSYKTWPWLYGASS